MPRSTLFGVLLLSIGVIALPWPATAETRVALVIGNSAYQIGPLGSPKDDAEAVEAKLKIVRFQVTRKTNLGYKEFLDAIRDFGDRLQQPETVGLFYYSGHGMQVNNRNYMIPTDVNIRSEVDVEERAVSVERVLKRMELGKSNPNFVILDACRNNPFEKRFKSSQNGLAEMGTPVFHDEGNSRRGALIAFAAEPGGIAEAGSGGKLSHYTKALVTYIHQPYPTYISMFQDVHDAVGQLSGGRQMPYLSWPCCLSRHFSFKPMDGIAEIVSVQQQANTHIERLLESQNLSIDDIDRLKQLQAGFSSLSTQMIALKTEIRTSEPPVGLAGGDVDPMIGSMSSSLQQMTSNIEELLQKNDLNEREAHALQWLMLKRAELSILISQIQTSAHETRKHSIQSIRN